MEAGEFLYSVAELMEEVDFSRAFKLYKHNIKFLNKVIQDFTIQAKLHEIAEIYLKIAELYGEKLQDIDAQRKYILKSIEYLRQEINLISGFNENGIETRKLAQNLQNVAELYLKVSDYKNAIIFYEKVIDLAKYFDFFDLISFSYQQISMCFEELDDYNTSKEIMLDGVEYFSNLLQEYEEKNDYLAIAQISQVLKKLYRMMDDEDNYFNYTKKEAGAYLNLAESLEKKAEEFQKIARYFRGAALCYQDIKTNLIESASCFVLAGNYSEKIEDYNESGVNFSDGAYVFKDLKNYEMSYKHFVKAGDNFSKMGDLNQSTENYLNAYDVAIEGNLEFNRFGIFNQIVRSLNKIAEEGLKNKQFFAAATLILESIKFYEQLDIAKDIVLREMVRNVYKYYYKAANLKKIGFSHIVHSYVLASLSSILNGKIKKAREIMAEIGSDGRTVSNYKEMIELIIKWVMEGKKVKVDEFPYYLKRLIEGSEEIIYLLNLFRGLQPLPNLLS